MNLSSHFKWLQRSIIDWNSSATHILTNSALHEDRRQWLNSHLPTTGSFSAHIWLATSGATRQRPEKSKWIALSKQALLTSAQAVNSHLEATSQDVWLHALPHFHVGAVGIWARAYLSGSTLVDYGLQRGERWRAERFCSMAAEFKATLSSLVPTQVYDFVQQGLRAPPSLRAIVVGGGALPAALWRHAELLGWCLLPSYGLSECSSQVATASLKANAALASAPLVVLAHVRVQVDDQQRLMISSPSLLTTYAIEEKGLLELCDPKCNGWLVTEDRVLLDEGGLHFQGRCGEMVKVGGECVDIGQLEQVLLECMCEGTFTGDAALFAAEEKRLGWVVHLACAVEGAVESEAIAQIVEAFNRRVLPFERIRAVRQIKAIPRTALGKVIRAEIS